MADKSLEPRVSETIKEFIECPICLRSVPKHSIEIHANRCIFLNEDTPSTSTASSSNNPFIMSKRQSEIIDTTSPLRPKKLKLSSGANYTSHPFKSKVTKLNRPNVIHLSDDEDDTPVLINVTEKLLINFVRPNFSIKF